jgi:hypothetical protein
MGRPESTVDSCTGGCDGVDAHLITGPWLPNPPTQPLPHRPPLRRSGRTVAAIA